MRTISQVLFQARENHTITLVDGPNNALPTSIGFDDPATPPSSILPDPETGAPLSAKATTDESAASIPPRTQRVKKSELELVYTKDPVVFNSINKIVQTIMSGKHTIKAKDPTVKSYFDGFVDRMGSTGSLITWNELLSLIFQNQCIYGGTYVENIFNKNGTRIVDWDLFDPKKMDYAKDSSGRIIFDTFGRPIGYTQTLPFAYKVPEEKKMKYPAGIFLPQNSIYVPAERVAFIKLYAVGDGIYPYGLVESIYTVSLRKLNMEEALANAIWRHGFPIVIGKLGDQSHEPTPQQVANTQDKLKDLNYKSELVVPYYYDFQILESKKAEKLREHLEYYKEQEIAGLGIPRPYAIGGGAGENRSVLDNMSNLFQLTLKDIVARTSSSIRRFMFAPLCKLEGFTEIPTIEWDLIGVDELDKKAARLVAYAQAGLLLPGDMVDSTTTVSGFIKKLEGMQ